MEAGEETSTNDGMQGRSLLKDADLTPSDLGRLLALAGRLKVARRSGRESPRLIGRVVALIFEKPSTRTRCAFEVAAAHQGAQITYLDPAGSHMGKLESLEDTARVLGRFYDGIGYRAKDQASVEALGYHAEIPVWNALTNQWHPTQALADLLTIREHSPKPWSEISLAYLGDGSGNVANSLRVAGALVGMTVRIVCPAALSGDPAVLATSKRICRTTSGTVFDTEDIEQGIRGVDFIYTDTWVRIGEPVEQWRDRVTILASYRVDQDLLARTENPNVKYLHNLPAIHNAQTTIGRQIYEETGLDAAEVTDEVFKSEASIVFDQAENRMHTIKAVMVASLGTPDHNSAHLSVTP